MWNGLPVVIFGTSGHAKEIACIIRDINSKNHIRQYDFLGFVAENDEKIGKRIGGEVIIASDNTFRKFSEEHQMIGVILPMTSSKVKRKVYESLISIPNLVYPNVISPYATIGDINSLFLGIGNIIAGGTTITCDITMGNFNLLNRNVALGHDCKIGDFCTINPTASISGQVTVKDNVLIGAGATVMQGITIGESSTVGLGGFVVKDVPNNTVMVCKQAEQLRQKVDNYSCY